MSEETAAGSEVMSSARLAQFQDEVAKLKLKGGGANPERNGANWGIGLGIVGAIIVVIAWLSAKGGEHRDPARRRGRRADRRARRPRRRRAVGAQLAHPLPALLADPPDLRRPRADRAPHHRHREARRQAWSALARVRALTVGGRGTERSCRGGCRRGGRAPARRSRCVGSARCRRRCGCPTG